MNRFLFFTSVIILTIFFPACQTSKVWKDPPLPEPIQNLYILPTIHSGEIRWKVIVEWTAPPSGRLRIRENSETILDTEINSRILIGNQVSPSSALFQDIENDSNVEWIVEWLPYDKKSTIFRIKRILSAELKTSVQKYLRNL